MSVEKAIRDGLDMAARIATAEERLRCVRVVSAWLALPYNHVGKDAAANLLAALRDPSAKVGEEEGG